MKKTDLAYIAGIVDGEGCISTYLCRKREVVHIKLAISNTSKTLMKYLSNKLDFGFRESKKHINRKQQYRMIFTNKKAISLIKKIYPYLIIKNPYSKLMLKFCFNKQGVHLTEDELESRRYIRREIFKLNGKRLIRGDSNAHVLFSGRSRKRN